MILALLLAAAAAAPPALTFPVACTLGQDCVIQNYPDKDPGPGVTDYHGLTRTYDQHDGTDIRLRSLVQMRAGVAVLAAAAGTVLRVRDGMADVSMRTQAFTPGQDCGNGLVIDHGGGWETQYCHMARGSLIVLPGQRVAAGEALGKVGLSGNTEFPHLHITVRQDGKAIDPFSVPFPDDGNHQVWREGSVRGRQLWRPGIVYRQREVLAAGFSAGPVTIEQAQENGNEAGPRPSRTKPLVAYVQTVGLGEGEVQQLILYGPDGTMLAENLADEVDRYKAQVILFVGKRAPPGGWPAGVYRAEYSIRFGAAGTVLAKQFRITL